MPEPILLTRDCDAIQIPSGQAIHLSAGDEVMITQSLGGSYTVATRDGLAKIAGKDADALGLEPVAAPAAGGGSSGGPVEEAQVWEALKTCYDPEIPVNIVDLGLVYDCVVEPGEAGTTRVLVKMTLTAPGCGMGPAIAAEAKGKILALPGVDTAEVDLVWEPAWNQGMISEKGRMQLGLV
jgi:probable FeS assembly SUF system protein SufT